MLKTYITNGKPACPYCGSTSSKEMSAYTRRYPKPAIPAVMNDSYHQALYNWQNGYVCLKCNREYIAVYPPTSSVQSTIATPAPLPMPTRKKRGFFGKAIMWAVIFLLGYMAYNWFTQPQKPVKSKPAKVAKSDTPKAEPTANIEKSQDMNDTVKTTETRTITKAN